MKLHIIAAKDLLISMRDRNATIFMFLLPMVLITVAGLALGGEFEQNIRIDVLVVNLDYTQSIVTEVVGPGPLEVFNARRREWGPASDGSRAEVSLMAGGGKLLRLAGEAPRRRGQFPRWND